MISHKLYLKLSKFYYDNLFSKNIFKNSFISLIFCIFFIQQKVFKNKSFKYLFIENSFFPK
ncbi:MAG: hypothetical protein CO119_09325 [Flavobacteriales bacterium CG_4_9_14_3_um_filter_40_17]|nr:MAG: hypothetical protein CO119_09325 [Flavobacteriales bacterium CG_4_9_14_3_um_filter_40_17]